MATVPLTLHLEEGDIPTYGVLFHADGRCQVSVYAPPLQVIAQPRQLRRWADELVALADRACSEEDERTDGSWVDPEDERPGVDGLRVVQ